MPALKFLGRTRTPELRALEEFYAGRIRTLAPCRIVETREARGFDERRADRILEYEAEGLEKRLQDDYIICLFDQGTEMTSFEFARFLSGRLRAPKPPAFVVGGSRLAEACSRAPTCVFLVEDDPEP
jgi:23S rRNA pseudoU1915 N3-methylase RlmH